MKTEAIEKAEKVIHLLNDEMSKTGHVIGELEREKNQSRAEGKSYSKRLVEVTKEMHT